jgi:ATP-dependent RNA helicase DeaD
VGAITNEGGLTGRDVGRIEMFDAFSFVEIAPVLTRDVMRRLAKARVAGHPLRFRPDAREQARPPRNPKPAPRPHRKGARARRPSGPAPRPFGLGSGLG